MSPVWTSFSFSIFPSPTSSEPCGGMFGSPLRHSPTLLLSSQALVRTIHALNSSEVFFSSEGSLTCFLPRFSFEHSISHAHSCFLVRSEASPVVPSDVPPLSHVAKWTKSNSLRRQDPNSPLPSKPMFVSLPWNLVIPSSISYTIARIPGSSTWDSDRVNPRHSHVVLVTSGFLVTTRRVARVVVCCAQVHLLRSHRLQISLRYPVTLAQYFRTLIYHIRGLFPYPGHHAVTHRLPILRWCTTSTPWKRTVLNLQYWPISSSLQNKRWYHHRGCHRRCSWCRRYHLD